MPRPGDRRPMIADHAISVLARGGARALTHHAVDRAAGLPAGSTSYYFRSRAALRSATVDRIRYHSRSAFDEVPIPDPLSVRAASTFVSQQLHSLATDRREQALAVIALLSEVRDDVEQSQGLVSCLFSATLAAELARSLGCTRPSEVAEDLVDFLMGRLIRTLYLPSPKAHHRRAATQRSVERLLLSNLT